MAFGLLTWPWHRTAADRRMSVAERNIFCFLGFTELVRLTDSGILERPFIPHRIICIPFCAIEQDPWR